MNPNLKPYHLEFIMPCFCAGADQAVAEIRAPSIRGQLRWWFRALGGTYDEELRIFGGINSKAKKNENKTVASSILVRIGKVNLATKWIPPKVNKNAHDSYVWYYASVSGKIQGSRWKSDANIPPGSNFELYIIQSRPIETDIKKKFDDAVKCFLALGGIGLRVTRGLGTFVCVEQLFTKEIVAILNASGYTIEHRMQSISNFENVATEIGSLLKGSRKACSMKATSASPFGSSTPRQTSSIYFRPIRPTGESTMQLVIFQVPESRVLGNASRTRDTKPVVGQTPSRLQKDQSKTSYRR